MKRKLVLMLGTFILLLFAFGVYQLFVPGIAIFDPKTRGVRPNFKKIRPGEGPQIGETSEIRLIARNAAGQLRGIYKVSSWTKEDDDSFTLINPTAVVYLKEGRRAYISAEKGQIWASEVPGGIDVRHGFFKGNVKIYFDQSTDLNRKHPADREHDKVMEECVSIFTNDIHFSRDMLEIKTDSRVVVWSKMLDIVGEGLLLQWNEDPRELRRLKIEKGELMIVKDLPENMDLMQMTNPEDQAKKTIDLRKIEKDKTPATAKAKLPEPKTAVAVAPSAAEPPSGNPVKVKHGDKKFDVDLAAEDIGPKDAPDLKPKRKAPTGRNKYKAIFSNDVRVYSGTQKLEGAEQLAIHFEWEELAWRESQKKKGEKKKTANSQPTNKSAMDIASSQPSSRPAMDIASAEKETRKSTADKRRLEIHWDGPLEIMPFDTVPILDIKRFKIIGKGKRIVLTNSETNMTCICSEFEIQNPRTSAFFRADKKSKTPVLFTVSGRERIVCNDYIRCDIKDIDGVRNIQTFLVGAGEVKTFNNEDAAFRLNPDDLDDPDQNDRAFDRRITWSKGAEVILDLLEVTTASGERKKQPMIKKVIAKKDVEIIKMPDNEKATEITNYIKCGQVNVDFGNLPDGTNYWKKAHASGNISALLDGNAITGKEITVYFKKPPPKDKQDKLAKSDEKKKLIDSLGESETRPAGAIIKGINFDIDDVSRLIAKGNIRIWFKDPKKPESPESRLEGESLDVLLDPAESGKSKFRGLLTGKPAKVWQGDDGIEGDVIQFNSVKEIIRVSGRGRLNFKTDLDFNGNKLKKPRKLNVSWSRSMLIYGLEGYAIVDGDVNLISKGDILQCNQARLFFEKKASTDAAETASDDKKTDQWSSLGVGLPSLSNRKFTQIEAHGGMGDQEMVIMRSHTMNPKNPIWLQRRIELTGETLIFRPPTRQAESKGKGALLVEDYRHPEEKTETQKDANTTAVGEMQRPSQTVFKWKDRMTLNQNDKHVAAWGDVTMKHLSGKDVISVGEEQTEPWGELKTGQTIFLGCSRMDAYFDEPTEEEKQKRKDKSKDSSESIIDSGPQLGSLKRFKAFKDVTFKYDQSTIDGQSIEFLGPTKTLIVKGYLPGDKKRTNAHFEFTDPKDGLLRSFDSPSFIIENFGEPNETFKLDKMEGKGAR